ncbi:MAG TPA: ATP synthase F1 subunit delta [Vicinamibacterales bacterium]|nr:ATP synthase F1 subunit delta [Vicinamibacterales bacterium]
MSPALARRYAAALFDVVQRTGKADEAVRDLLALRDLVAAHDELRRAFEARGVPAAQKKKVLEAVVAQVGLASVEVARLLGLMAERDRLAMIPAVAAAFEARVNQARRIMPADIVTAAPLDEVNRTAIAGALERATGNEVRLRERVDGSLVGGVVARVGSIVFDGSVARQIERLRERLLTGA